MWSFDSRIETIAGLLHANGQMGSGNHGRHMLHSDSPQLGSGSHSSHTGSGHLGSGQLSGQSLGIVLDQNPMSIGSGHLGSGLLGSSAQPLGRHRSHSGTHSPAAPTWSGSGHMGSVPLNAGTNPFSLCNPSFKPPLSIPAATSCYNPCFNACLCLYLDTFTRTCRSA